MSKCTGLLLLSTLAVAGARPRSLPLMFEANLGQAEPGAAFLGRGPGYAIHFDGAGISLVHGQDIVRMDLQGATTPRISGNQPQEGRSNYFIGNSAQWITDVPLYAGIQYSGVYPGVDLVFYSSEGELEYDFTLAPGASASNIRLAFRGIDEMRIDGGDLVLKTGWGELRHRRPRIYQMRNGQRSEVAGRFVIRGPKEAGFETDPYDAGSTLVIDPVMAYGTYIGGSGADSAWAVAVDPAGAAYVVGETWPVNFPKTFTISNSGGNGDAFIIKLNPSGTGILYATYFGGSSRDSARGVAVDSAGNAYVTGFTNSSNFPTTAGSYRSPSLGLADAFAIKVNATGSALVYSALIGGAGSDYATGIAIDSLGSAYIAGYTSSVAFPVTSGGFQKSYGGGVQDAFVAKLNSSGSGLIYCTYLGGIGNDVANGIAVDAAGQAYVVGYTDSTDFPTRSPIYANSGGQGDGFVAKLTPAGDSLAFSTYLGGSLVDIATAVALDSTGNVYVTGTTLSANFPVTGGAFQTVNHGSYDAFISKMDSLGTTMLYSTYLGGEGSDQSSSIAVDANGVAYIAGFTYSYHFPLQGPIQPATHGGQEAFAAAVGSAGSSLVWSTYLGGAADDQATGVAVDALGDVYVVGSTFSSDFPVTSGAYRTVYSGGDGFVVKVGTPVPQAVSVTPSSGNGASQTFAFQFSDALGSRDIAVAGMLINGSLSSVQGCEVQYASAANQFTLLNDAGTGPVGVATPGSTTILWNSQCELSAAGSGTVQSGNSLTVTIQVRFSFGFTGSKTWWSQSRNNTGVASSWQLMGTWTVAITPGDFDGNGVTDLILQNDSTRAAGVWYLNGPDATDLLFIDYPAPGSYPGWTLVAVADMDGNGVPDLIWQNDVMRTVGVWYMGGPHGTNILYIDYPAPGAYLGWTLVSVHDMNGDGIPDLIWQNDSTREVGVWLLSGPTATSVLAFESVSSSNPGWTLVGVGDFDGNGVPDLVWQNDSTRAVQVWYMGGAQGMNVLSAAWLAPGSYLGWKVVAISDLDHNGVPDLVWQNDSTRSVGTWYMGGVKGATVLYFGSQATGNYPGWRAIGPK